MMATIQRFEDVQAWQKGRALVRAIYETCTKGKLSKDFGLRGQLCRAAVSAMTNIAEGFARETDNNFAHFLDIAKGSAVEVQSLLYVALDVGYISESQFQTLYQQAGETIRLIAGFSNYLRSRPRSGHRLDNHATNRLID